MMKAELRRKPTAHGYSYNITIEGKKPKVLKRRKNYSYWLDKVEVWFNEYVFDTFDTIPLKYDYEWDKWFMVHEYRQVEGNASAPYEIIA